MNVLWVKYSVWISTLCFSQRNYRHSSGGSCLKLLSSWIGRRWKFTKPGSEWDERLLGERGSRRALFTLETTACQRADYINKSAASTPTGQKAHSGVWNRVNLPLEPWRVECDLLRGIPWPGDVWLTAALRSDTHPWVFMSAQSLERTGSLLLELLELICWVWECSRPARGDVSWHFTATAVLSG